MKIRHQGPVSINTWLSQVIDAITGVKAGVNLNESNCRGARCGERLFIWFGV